jgi:hypothetical protein
VSIAIAHHRKNQLGHVPGRHSGPGKTMPAWLSDGPMGLKIPGSPTPQDLREEERLRVLAEIEAKALAASGQRLSPLRFLK